MTPRTARAGRARRGEGEQLRSQLLDAAERLLVARGSMEAVPIRAIADEIGVTPPALYLHFSDKNDLFFQVCSRRFEEFAAALVAAVEGVEGVIAQLEALGRAYVRYGLEHPEQYRILFGQRFELPPYITDPGQLPGLRAFRLLVEVIEQGMQDGSLVAGDPAQAAIGLWATVHGLVMLVEAKDDMVPDVDIAGAIDAVLGQAIRGLAR